MHALAIFRRKWRSIEWSTSALDSLNDHWTLFVHCTTIHVLRCLKYVVLWYKNLPKNTFQVLCILAGTVTRHKATCKAMKRSYYTRHHYTINVKINFLRFFILVMFLTFFNVFFIFQQTFFLFFNNVDKFQSGKQINKKHFQNYSNEIDLWFFCCMSNIEDFTASLKRRQFLLN